MKPILEWKETSPEDFETDSVQSVSSDASEDFFDNFDPEVERQIVRNHLKYLDQLVTEIARTTPIILEAFDRRANLEKQQKAKAPPKRKTIKGPFADFWKFPVQQGRKEPACKWRDPTNQTKGFIPPTVFNTGVLTGSRNNLLVVDLDVKDDGVTEFQNYCSEFGAPETLTVLTPSGGDHYCFKFSHSDPDCELMIKHYLTNATKFRGKGIDIRGEGGYVVGPPSCRDGESYEVKNDAKPIDLPASLITWLLEGRGSLPCGSSTKGATEGSRKPRQSRTPTTASTAAETNFDFDLNGETATQILSELPERFLTNFSDWFLVTGILKKHGLKTTWEQWSKNASNYDQAKNEQIWNSSAGILDINYLVFLLRRAGSEREFVAKWRPYHPITKDLSEVKQISLASPLSARGSAGKHSNTTKQSSSNLAPAPGKPQPSQNTWKTTRKKTRNF